MGRGFISGIVWGAIVGAFIVVLASQMAVQQDLTLPRPNATPVEVPVGTEFNQPRPESDPVVPQTDAARAGDEVATAPLSPVAEIDDLPVAETEPVNVPVPRVESPESGSAPDVTETPEIEVSDGTTPLNQSSSDPVTPPASAPAVTLPEVVQGETPPAPAPAAPAPVAPSIAENATEDTPNGVIAVPQDQAPEQIAPGGLALLTPGDAPATPEALPGSDDPVEAQEAPQTDDTPSVEETPAVAEPIGVPVPPAEELAPQVRTNQLPQIGGTQEEPEAEAEIELPVVTEIETPDEGALRAFRRGFDNPDDRPLLSVVLVHHDSTDLEALVGLPFPISVAVDVASPNAADVAKRVRNAGGEVVMIPALPEGGAPEDIEVALQSNIALIPEAVALMDLPEASFQSNRAAVTQIVAAVADSGHALVTFPRGLNTAQKLAERDGVPTGLIFRDLQGSGQASADIRRTLDQAAFRARQQSSVILVGRATPEAVAALTEWALGNRAATVSMAPVSAAILGEETAG